MNDRNPYEAPQNPASHSESIVSPLSRNDVGCLFSFLGFFAGAYRARGTLPEDACGLAGLAVLSGGIVGALFAGIAGLLVGFALRLRSRRASGGLSDPDEMSTQEAWEEIVVVEQLLRSAEASADRETAERLGVYKARLLRNHTL